MLSSRDVLNLEGAVIGSRGCQLPFQHRDLYFAKGLSTEYTHNFSANLSGVSKRCKQQEKDGQAKLSHQGPSSKRHSKWRGIASRTKRAVFSCGDYYIYICRIEQRLLEWRLPCGVGSCFLVLGGKGVPPLPGA